MIETVVSMLPTSPFMLIMLWLLCGIIALTEFIAMLSCIYGLDEISSGTSLTEKYSVYFMLVAFGAWALIALNVVCAVAIVGWVICSLLTKVDLAGSIARYEAAIFNVTTKVLTLLYTRRK